MGFKNKIITALAILLILPIIVSATNYYVDKNSIGGQCNDNENPGTITNPWCTINKANTMLQAGDTVYIRQGIYSDNDGNAIINPDNSGSAGNPITYTNYQDEEVILRSITDSNLNRGALINKNYIMIDGLKFDNIDQSQSQMDYFIYIPSNKHHNIIKNCVMKYLSDNWASYSDGIIMQEGANYNQILDNVIEYVGKDSDNSQCNGIRMQDGAKGSGCHHNLIQGNTVRYAGHAGIQARGYRNIIKDNIVYNPWNKCLENTCDTGDTSNQYNVWDNNVGYGTTTGSGWRQDLFQNMGTGIIIRYNRIYTGEGEGFRLYGKTDKPSKRVKIYNNVAYDCGNDEQAGTDTGITFNERDADTMDSIDVRNNIFYNNHRDGIRWLENAQSSEHTVTNNHWQADGNPNFVNPPDDFSIQPDSPAIDAGAWLTTTMSAGSGTNLPIEDASYFIDGFGIVEGDVIQLEGQSFSARITNVNYDTNTLTLNRSLTWTNSQGVSLAYSGSAPDIGAYEFNSGETPPPPEPLEGDLNNDTRVDIEDLIIVASNFGTDDDTADTDSNGIVDIFDVVFVATRII